MHIHEKIRHTLRCTRKASTKKIDYKAITPHPEHGKSSRWHGICCGEDSHCKRFDGCKFTFITQNRKEKYRFRLHIIPQSRENESRRLRRNHLLLGARASLARGIARLAYSSCLFLLSHPSFCSDRDRKIATMRL